jgi:hypothetical protein
MLAIILRQASEKAPMQNPLNREVYNVSLRPPATAGAKLAYASNEYLGTISLAKPSKLKIDSNR